MYHRDLVGSTFVSIAFVVSLLATVGCQTTSHGERGNSAVGAPELVEAPPSLPADTLLAARLDLERTDQLQSTLHEYLPEGATKPPESLSAERLIGAVLGRHASLKNLDSGSNDEWELQGLDGQGQVFGVLRRGPHEDFLAGVELALPPADGGMYGGLPRNFPVALFLPSDAPEAFADELRNKCELEGGASSCSRVQRVSFGKSYVKVELAIGEGDEDVSSADLVVGRGWDLSRETPAVRHFLDPGTAASLYVEAASLAPLAALNGGLDVAGAVESVSSENKTKLLLRAASLLAASWAPEAPEAREFEDLAISIEADEGGGLVGQLVQTYTERGREVARAGLSGVERRPKGEPANTLELHWSYDVGAALEAAQIPDWMGSADRHDIYRTLRVGGAWVHAMPLLNYPTGFAKWYDREAGAASEPFRLASRLTGGMAALDVEPKSSSRVPQIRGTVTLFVDDEVERVPMASAIRRMAGSLGVEFGTELREADGQTKVVLTFGEAESPEFAEHDSSDARAGLVGRVDLEPLARTMEGTRGPAALVAQLLESLGTAGVQTASSERAWTMRLRVGTDEEGGPLEIPRSTVDLYTHEPRPNRLAEFRSRQTLKALEDTSPEGHLRAADSILEKAKETRKGLDDEELLERLDVVAGQWNLFRASAAEQGSWWSVARASYKSACEFGLERGCENQKRLDEFFTHFTPTEIPGHVETVPKGPPFPFVTSRGLEFGGEVVVSNQALEKAYDGEATETIRDVDRVLRFQNDCDEDACGIAMEPAAFVSGRIVAFLVHRAFQQRMSEVRRRERRQLGKWAPDAGPAEVKLGIRPSESDRTLNLPVDSPPAPAAGPYDVEDPAQRRKDTDGQGRFVRIETRDANSDSEGSESPDPSDYPVVRAELSHAGVDLSMSGNEVEPIEGCEDARVTVCADDERLRQFAADIDSALSDGETVGARRGLEQYHAAYPVAAVYDKFVELRDAHDGPLGLYVTVEDDVPFAAVARVLVSARHRRKGGGFETFEELAGAEMGQPLFEFVALGMW